MKRTGRQSQLPINWPWSITGDKAALKTGENGLIASDIIDKLKVESGV